MSLLCKTMSVQGVLNSYRIRSCLEFLPLIPTSPVIIRISALLVFFHAQNTRMPANCRCVSPRIYSIRSGYLHLFSPDKYIIRFCPVVSEEASSLVDKRSRSFPLPSICHLIHHSLFRRKGLRAAKLLPFESFP